MRVVVTDVDMKFGTMIVFMIKWAIAAVPAAFILSVIVGLVGVLFLLRSSRRLELGASAGHSTLRKANVEIGVNAPSVDFSGLRTNQARRDSDAHRVRVKQSAGHSSTVADGSSSALQFGRVGPRCGCFLVTTQLATRTHHTQRQEDTRRCASFSISNGSICGRINLRLFFCDFDQRDYSFNDTSRNVALRRGASQETPPLAHYFSARFAIGLLIARSCKIGYGFL